MTAAGFPAHELIVDSFAGGGGASRGIEIALGRSPDIAINHDDEALAMHRANHPSTMHVPHNVWKVDPLHVTGGRPVGLLWASPDCKHHSKAKGGKPVQRNIRDLAWVVVRWAKQVRMCGNSVCPPLAHALVAANYVPDQPPLKASRRRRAPAASPAATAAGELFPAEPSL